MALDLESGAALTTVVGELVEVPVMLSLVAVANRARGSLARDRCKRATNRFTAPRAVKQI